MARCGRRRRVFPVVGLGIWAACAGVAARGGEEGGASPPPRPTPTRLADAPHLQANPPPDWSTRDAAWWARVLSVEQVRVCREGGTERPGTGALLHVDEPGQFVCSSCGLPLFDAAAKFESGTGWPSFWAARGDGAVRELEDRSLGVVRTEVRCGRCDAHLGHVFPDGPPPTGRRYCINSVCLLHAPGGSR